MSKRKMLNKVNQKIRLYSAFSTEREREVLGRDAVIYMNNM